MWGFLSRLLIIECVLVALLFGSAGRWDLPWFWALVGVHATGLFLMGLVIDPELRRERLKPGPGAKDAFIRKLLLPFLFAHVIVAGLDVGRFGWSGSTSWPSHAAGLGFYALGLGLSVWAMATNRFFSPVVRHQTERGHHVVSSGPYRLVRHPGYAGLILSAFSGGVAMGSWWSLAPLLPILWILIWRIRMEERFLREKLDGYDSYADRVRYRLCPGVW
ncbi:MAG: isoprenylcysteine carboxylmethyltransferase family protein [Isosphaeraceae bacterium]